ncbi:serine hydrolase [Paraburkholderia tropica]|uniref:serine hydrolase n=1 Tax=Paraburkholderia tropica TaxID=92647 RepID=UPI002AB0371A|nr:serine hydrolase [Paraburkholderia tropica]
MISLSRLPLLVSALLLAGLTATASFAATTPRHRADPHVHAAAKKKKITRKPRSAQRTVPALAAAKTPDAKRRGKRAKTKPLPHGHAAHRSIAQSKSHVKPHAKVHAKPHVKAHPKAHVKAPAKRHHAKPPVTTAQAESPNFAPTIIPYVAPQTSVSTTASATQGPHLLARCGYTPASRKRLFSRSVFIVDEQTHTPLFARNADAVVPIASVSKLMTAVVWLDQNHAPLARRIDVTDADLDTLKFTHSRLTVGSSLTRANMLHIALMSSENRAASALSRDYPGGQPAFVDAMNAKAASLGMPHTHFVNATGLSPQNVSTARELARLVRAANGYPLIRRYSTDHQERVPTGRGQLQYVNSNRLVRYNRVQASLQKTGFINESGHNMVMRMMVHGRRPVIVTMLGSASAEGSRLDGERIHHWLNCSLR